MSLAKIFKLLSYIAFIFPEAIRMLIEQLSPYIRVAMDSKINFPWHHLKERVLFDYELLYVKEGRVKVTIGDQYYTGEPGDLFLFRPKQRHTIRKIGTSPLNFK